MKTIKSYIKVGAASVLLLSSISCSKSFYTNANVNPNAPNSVPSNTLLTGIEVTLAYTQGGAMSQFTSMFTQQTYGNQRQAAAYYTYILTPADPEYQWDQMYTDVMENDYTLMNQAKSAGQNEYYGISNIIMAYSLQTMVDEFGNIPYSAGLQGSSNIQPAYDNGQTLYSTILTLLNTGIGALRSSPGTSAPSSDDVIYQGNTTDWIQFAYAIKARIFIHQCKHGNAALEDSAIAAVQAAGVGVSSSTFVNAVVNFGASATNNGPWYQFNNQRPEYIYAVPSSLIDSMQAMNDPRDSIFVNFATSSMGNYYGSATSPVEFITTEELYLIAAEAFNRSGNAAASQGAYTDAIVASMTKLGVPPAEAATYEASPVATLSPTAANALHQIGVQQWIVEYVNPEAWTSWRRNNAPYLAPTAGSNGVVRRMIYPNSEQTLNPNCPTGVTLWSPTLFWDN